MDDERRYHEQLQSIFGYMSDVEKNTQNSSCMEENMPSSDSSSEDVEFSDDDENEVSAEEEVEVSSEYEPHVLKETLVQSQLSSEFLEEGPQPGLEFRSHVALLNAYQHHGEHKGFCVAIRRNTGRYILIVCHRGRVAKVVKATQRINCPARVNAIKQDNGMWVVSRVVKEHNHELDPTNSCFMAPHRNLTVNMKRQLDANDIAGLRPCKNIRLLEVQAGGPANLGATEKDCRNFIMKRRKLRLGKRDAEAIQQLFVRLQKSDRNFFYLMDINDQGKLKNVMWIHPRSVAAYEEFNEVVSFDTTYLVNKYNMPFATVVGINHHNQSILLGCALLSNESTESFKWFWKNWLVAMGGVQPFAMLTDQCDQIRNAVSEVMPNTIHRLCIWHILSKTAKNFKNVVDHKVAVLEFNQLIYESLTIVKFESNWREFRVKFDLVENRWLDDLWNERESWVPVYLKHIFWAGCKSTQRSESMHSFFDGYIHSKSTLKQFVEQYEIAVCHKMRKEMRANYDSKTRVIKCFSQFKWEEQFQKVYTNAMFELFQTEIRGLWNCNVWKDPLLVEGVEEYEVHDYGFSNRYHKRYAFKVQYRTGDYINCDCKMFESRGILCSHVLKVITIKGIDLVNERYVMRRWRKDVYRRHTSIFFAGGYPHMTKEYKMFQDAEKIFQECTDKSYHDANRMELIKDVLNKLSSHLDMLGPGPVVVVESSDVDENNPNPILDPDCIIRRGRPRKSRFKPIEEIIKNKKKAKSKKESSTKTKGATSKTKKK